MRSSVRFLFASVATLAAIAFPVAQAQAATTKPFTCNTGKLGYYDCNSDNYAIPAGHQVYITITDQIGGGSTRFKIYNKNGHHLLWTGPYQNIGTGKQAAWYNNTSGAITIDIQAENSFLGSYVFCNLTF